MEKLEIQFTNHKTFQWHIFISGSDDQIREKILNNNFIFAQKINIHWRAR